MTLFIMNPASGTSSAAMKKKITLAIEKQSDCQLVYTQYAGHAKEIATKAINEGIKKVVAIGGDGTVNEIASALVGSQTALGIIPIGSGNGLARHLNIPLKVEKAIQLAINAQAQPIDTCYLNGIPFFCTAGVGFDAKVAHEFAKQTSRGLKTYAKVALKEFRAYKAEEYLIEINGAKKSFTAFTITFANATQYGNNAMISPLSQIDDGLVDLVILKPFPFGAAPIIGVRLFKGTLNNSRYVDTYQETNIKLTATQNLTIHLDGEPMLINTNEIKISISPKSLKVLSNKF
ncbi:MAG: diacylglycerol kinase family lipid kinase [Pseudarcicella sp.]|nr:diacylglycerol kinase family lipid kinase [Pseudarcicella sp.]MBP6410568.1 diacylglycerol kinase family lipid kinase [Pseudarcicella sp.]